MLFGQIDDVAVYQFGRKTDIVRHGVAYALVVQLLGGLVGEHRLYPAGGEEGVPERIVLVHAQSARDAYAQSFLPVVLRRTFPSEEQAVSFLEHVHSAYRSLFRPVVENLLAVVRGVVGMAVGECQLPYPAVVAAARAGQLLRTVSALEDQSGEGGGSLRGFRIAAHGVQGASIGPHQFRHVGEAGPESEGLFEGPDNRVVAEGASLYDHVVPQLCGIFQFQYLEQAVAHYRLRRCPPEPRLPSWPVLPLNS